jgi:hypothetical protein
LLAHDNIDEAFQILQQGLVYNYRRLNPAYLQLLEMNYAAAISLEDKDLAKALSSMLEISRQDYAVMLSAQRHNKIINPY